MSTLDDRCPQCGSLLRGAAEWCTLCHADLRPAPAPTAEAPAAPAEPVDALSAPLEQVLAELGARSAGAQAAGYPAPPAPGLPGAPADLPASPPTGPAVASAPASASQAAEPELDEAALAALAAVGLDPNRVAATPSTSSTPADGLDLEGIDDPDVMFALLRTQGQDPLLAKVGGRLDSKGAQALLIVGGATALAIGLFVVFTLLGLFVR